MDFVVPLDRRVWPGPREKVTAKCLWIACKALSAGFVLILIGAAMATLGFYADELSVVVHVDGNKTVLSKDYSRDYHLNNLTYVGPIVMGVGGFVIVATCVMTFEARDSAAKVVPARLQRAAAKLRSSTPHSARNALTSTFVQFSRTIQNSIETKEFLSEGIPTSAPIGRTLRKCPSEPNLIPPSAEPAGNNVTTKVSKNPTVTFVAPPKLNRLHPGVLPRQAISIDNPRLLIPTTIASRRGSITTPTPILKKTDSDASMAMDLYLPDCAITLRVQDETRTLTVPVTVPVTVPFVVPGDNPVCVALSVPVTMKPEPGIVRRETVKRRPLLRQVKVDTADSDQEDG